MKKFILMILIIASTSVAQQRQDPGLTEFPVAIWPADGKIPPELKDNYVFIDLARGQYLVAFPSNLGTAEFTEDPGELETRGFDMQRNVEPSISVAVTPTGPSKYQYEYTISNQVSAKEGIDQWNLVMSAEAGDSTILSPEKWVGFVQKGRTFGVKKPEWIRSGSSALWFFGASQGQISVDMKLDGLIEPGMSKGGFVLESGLRPGFTLAYFRRSINKAGPDPSYPIQVREQVKSVLQLEYNSKTTYAIGPKFEANIPDQTIISDFAEGVASLSRAGVLDPNSDFVKNTLDELNRGVRDKLNTSQIRLNAQPRTPAETDVLNALKVSLHLNRN
jgi:hypothetical protein